MRDSTLGDRRTAPLAIDARLAAYVAAVAALGAAVASDAQAEVVGSSAEQSFGVNGDVSIDFNSDGQTDFQIDHDRVDLGESNGGQKDFLQIDKNDINGAGNPLAFDPGPGTTFQATPFMDGATPRNDANNSAYLITGPQGSYPAALTFGTPIGTGSTFDYQEGDNFQGTGKWIRANRLIDEDATLIDQVLGGRTPAGVQVPTSGPNFLGLAGDVRYVGVQMELNNSGTFNYGWIGVRIDNEADATGAVVGYAYETLPGVPILAGVVPEPMSMVLAGAMLGTLFMRRASQGDAPLSHRVGTRLTHAHTSPTQHPVDGGDESQSVRHLVDLGYEDPLEVTARERAAQQRRSEACRRAESLLSAGQTSEAIAALERLADEAPNWTAPHVLLAHAYRAAGRFDLALQHLDWLKFHGCETAQLALLRAGLAFAQRRFDVALDQATYARCLDPGIAGADAMAGQLHVRRGRLDDAEHAYRRELTHHPASAAALAGMSAVRLRHGDCEGAVDWALRALEQDIRLPAVHYRLGVALARLGRAAEAVTALETAAKLKPGFAAPFRLLAKVALEQLADAARAAEYQRQGRERLRQRRHPRPPPEA